MLEICNCLNSAEKVNLGVPQLPGQGCSFHSFRTNTYKLSFMETPSGIKVNRNGSVNNCGNTYFGYIPWMLDGCSFYKINLFCVFNYILL